MTFLNHDGCQKAAPVSSYVRGASAADSLLFLLLQLLLQTSEAPTTAKAAASVAAAPQISLLSSTSTTEFRNTNSQQFALEKGREKGQVADFSF